MKNMETIKDIPVIMMSSDSEMEIITACMEKGAADYLIKPIRLFKIKIKEYNMSKILPNI